MFEALFNQPKQPDAGHPADITTRICPADMSAPEMSGSSPVDARRPDSAIHVESLLTAVMDAGAIILVGGAAELAVEPRIPTLVAQLRDARDALLEALHARGAWTEQIPPAAAEKTRSILERYDVEPVLVQSEDALQEMLAELTPLPTDTLIGIDIETQPHPDLSAGLDSRRADIRTVQL